MKPLSEASQFLIAGSDWTGERVWGMLQEKYHHKNSISEKSSMATTGIFNEGDFVEIKQGYHWHHKSSFEKTIEFPTF